MLNVACVTTFNDKIYNDYAYRMLNSYIWPFDLYVYTEDSTATYNHKVTEVRNLFKLDLECQEFVERNRSRPVSFYLYDGVRFCYKPFSVAHLAQTLPECDRIIFFDADFIFTNKKIDSEFVDSMLCGDDEMMAYFGRDKDVVQYSECGFLVFNLNHPKTLDYLKEVRRLYVSDGIYDLREQHDSYIWDHVRKKYESDYSINTRDLSSESDRRHNHPMASSFMNVYFDHLKGDRKKGLHSPEWLKSRGIDSRSNV